jgi:hypothetical protein
VQHHDPPTNDRAEENPSNTLRTFKPQLEEPASKCLGVWLAKIGAYGNHAAGQNNVPSGERVRQVENVVLHLFVEVLDLVFHTAIITNMLFAELENSSAAHARNIAA